MIILLFFQTTVFPCMKCYIFAPCESTQDQLTGLPASSVDDLPENLDAALEREFSKMRTSETQPALNSYWLSVLGYPNTPCGLQTRVLWYSMYVSSHPFMYNGIQACALLAPLPAFCVRTTTQCIYLIQGPWSRKIARRIWSNKAIEPSEFLSTYKCFAAGVCVFVYHINKGIKWISSRRRAMTLFVNLFECRLLRSASKMVQFNNPGFQGSALNTLSCALYMSKGLRVLRTFRWGKWACPARMECCL